MGKLVLQLPDGGTREYALERERTTIGRRADNDVCLPYPAVSGEHAAVVTILDDSFLEDLNSTNGTLVNGKAITKHFLRDHDEIDVGRHKLVYYSGDASAPSPPSPMRVGVEPDVQRSGDKKAVPAHPGGHERVQASPRTAERSEGTLPLHALVPSSSDSGPVDTVEWFAPPGGTAASPRETASAPADAPTLEVLEGPAAGTQCVVAHDEFVLGRLGVALALVRRTPDGFRLVHVEGDQTPRINGAALPSEGSLLALGDEIEIAGSRLVYRPAL